MSKKNSDHIGYVVLDSHDIMWGGPMSRKNARAFAKRKNNQKNGTDYRLYGPFSIAVLKKAR